MHATLVASVDSMLTLAAVSTGTAAQRSLRPTSSQTSMHRYTSTCVWPKQQYIIRFPLHYPWQPALKSHLASLCRNSTTTHFTTWRCPREVGLNGAPQQGLLVRRLFQSCGTGQQAVQRVQLAALGGGGLVVALSQPLRQPLHV